MALWGFPNNEKTPPYALAKCRMNTCSVCHFAKLQITRPQNVFCVTHESSGIVNYLGYQRFCILTGQYMIWHRDLKKSHSHKIFYSSAYDSRQLRTYVTRAPKLGHSGQPYCFLLMFFEKGAVLLDVSQNPRGNSVRRKIASFNCLLCCVCVDHVTRHKNNEYSATAVASN